jgi:hypothetical protein
VDHNRPSQYPRQAKQIQTQTLIIDIGGPIFLRFDIPDLEKNRFLSISIADDGNLLTHNAASEMWAS